MTASDYFFSALGVLVFGGAAIWKIYYWLRKRRVERSEFLTPMANDYYESSEEEREPEELGDVPEFPRGWRDWYENQRHKANSSWLACRIPASRKKSRKPWYSRKKAGVERKE